MRTDFVGRGRELAVLRECLAAARAARPGLVLCRGEPGIGKTRLAQELSALARADGCCVAWGTSAQDAGAPPYWPWRQVLRAVADDVDLRAVAREQGTLPDLRRLAPDLFGGAEDGVEDGAGSGSSEDRFRVFDAVDRLLGRVTRERPLVVVVDDAHWADPSSLLLLQHVARSAAARRLLVMVNVRDTEPLHDVLAGGLLREPATTEVELGGLAAPDVGAQLAALLGGPPADTEVERVHARTGGNPFYVGELGRALADGRAADALVPVGVREVIGGRLARLPAPAVRLLRAAAVVGREFPVDVVAAVLETPVLDCLALLDQTAAAGLTAATATPGEHRFVHDLVRDAVEAGLPAPARVVLHRRAARAIESVYAGRLEPHLSELARHWSQAAVAGERARAVGWIRRAADEAAHRLAHEEAARLYRLALAVGADEVDDATRCGVLLDLGGALRRAGELRDRLPTCREAAAAARRLRRPDLLAEAALVLEGGEADLESETTLRRLCEEALSGLGPDPTGLRARVSANLSGACMYLGDVEAAARASDEALRVAERSGDAVAVVAALRARQLVATGPDGLEERARLADRMEAAGRASGDPAARMWAHLWRIDVAFERGDLAAVASEVGPLTRCTEEVRGPVARWHLLQVRAVLAQAQARFADARRLADEALAALPPSATGRESSVINRTAVLAAVSAHTGEAADLSGLLGYGGPGDAPGTELDFPTDGVIFSIAAACFLASAGRLDDAARVYRRLGPPETWRPIPHAVTTCLALGIETAVALGASADVAALRELLGRLRGRHSTDGAGAVAYNGPVELYLGVAAAHLEHLDDAVADLGTAAAVCTASGAAGFAVQAQYELAAVLTRRDQPGDRTRARALATEVERRAAALGMAPWAARARRLVEHLDDERGAPLTPREREVAVLVGEGLTNRQIAARLYLSERTAQNHVQHILTKLGLPNRGQIAVWVATRT
jgi:DNA-binding CsgD family transcriptional regulator